MEELAKNFESELNYLGENTEKIQKLFTSNNQRS